MNNSEILIYQAANGKIKIDVRLEDETVWLTQDDMAGLFGKSKSTINEHIKNIFAEGELVETDVLKKFGISEFQQKAPNYYNLAFAETMAQQRIPMRMTDWIQRLDAIIQLNGRELLTHAGKISHQMAQEKAALEYDKFRESQRRIQHEESLKELEEDIKKLKPPRKKGGKS